MRYLFVPACAAALFLALAGGATAGSSLTLHPAGFGTMSYSAWKAQQGTVDDQGSANQALYFQKITSTTTVAAGVAVINGVEGLPVDELTGLSWWHREDGHCGAGAPRWNVGVQDGTGKRYTVFLGCNAAQHTETGATTNGFGWCQDTQRSTKGTTRRIRRRSAAPRKVNRRLRLPGQHRRPVRRDGPLLDECE